MRRWILTSSIAGIAGVVLLIAGWLSDPARAAFAYLTAYLYAISLAIGALFMVMISHAANVKWFVALRRVAEHSIAVFPLLALLFLPIFLARGLIYPWSQTLVAPDHWVAHALEARRWWLNDVGFGLRAVIYLGTFIAFAESLRRRSIAEDRHATATAPATMRSLALGGLVAVTIATTFSAFDWIMGVEAVFYSNAFGVYFFAGSFLAGLSLIALCTAVLLPHRVLPEGVGADHLHAVGRLMLAHTIFWAYIAFTQYLLVWIVDLPEEVPFYIHRMSEGWYPISLTLILGHFALPFAVLLLRSIKRRPRPLAAIAAWLLVVHYIDLYWLVLPALQPVGFQPHWLDAVALFGVGGLTLAFGLWRATQTAIYPIHDPALPASLRYEALL